MPLHLKQRRTELPESSTFLTKLIHGLGGKGQLGVFALGHVEPDVCTGLDRAQEFFSKSSARNQDYNNLRIRSQVDLIKGGFPS